MPVFPTSDGLAGIRAVSARRLPFNFLLATCCGKQNKDHQINLGATETRMGCVSPPLSLIQNRTDDFGASYPSQTQCTATAPAVHCIRPCSALHPSLQCTASFHRKRLHPFPQTFATAIVNVCIRHRKRLR